MKHKRKYSTKTKRQSFRRTQIIINTTENKGSAGSVQMMSQLKVLVHTACFYPHFSAPLFVCITSGSHPVLPTNGSPLLSLPFRFMPQVGGATWRKFMAQDGAAACQEFLH